MTNKLTEDEADQILAEDIADTLAREQIQVRVIGWPLCASCKKRVDEVTIAESLAFDGLKLTAKCHGETEEVWLDPREMRRTEVVDVTGPVFAGNTLPQATDKN